MSNTLVSAVQTGFRRLLICVYRTDLLASFPGLRPDFISQPWRKIGRRPGAIYHVMSAAVYVTVKQEVSYDLSLSTYIIRNACCSS